MYTCMTFHPISGRTSFINLSLTNQWVSAYPTASNPNDPRIECTIGVYGPHVSSCEIPSSLFFQPL